MLLKLSDEIGECYNRAEECRRRADTSIDPRTKADFLDMERRWFNLARSYEFAQRLSRFSASYGRSQKRDRAG
jgi:hypothetical protein